MSIKEQPRSFCTIFPNFRDFHFFKDPGQIPYRFSKLGYNTSLVCYGKGREFVEAEKYLTIKKLTDNYFSRKFNSGILFFLLINSRKIDILHTFHLTWSSLLFVYLYKILHRSGFSYLKLDNCAFAGKRYWEWDNKENRLNPAVRCKIKGRLKHQIIRRFFLNKVDLWSVEDEYSREIFEARYDFFRGKLITIYNGHTSDLAGSVSTCNLEDKEDIILTAGRLGTFQKATDILLDAFRSVASQTNYALHLAGQIDPAFKTYLDKFDIDNPLLKNRVIFHGPLGRDELYRLYCRSKIFCLPSRFEGMAIVFPEAMYYGNAIVTTMDVSLKYLVERFGFGLMVEKENSKALADGLLSVINDNELRDKMAQNAQELSSTLFNWDGIIIMLEKEIEVRLNSRT